MERSVTINLLMSLFDLECYWESISMDLCKDILDSNGFDTILIVVNMFSKMIYFMVIHKTVNTLGIVDLFIRNIFKLNRVPKDIVLDLDVRFVNVVWNEIF